MNSVYIFLLNVLTLISCHFAFRLQIKMSIAALKQSKLKNPVFTPNLIYRNLIILFTLVYLCSYLLLPNSVAGFNALAVGLLMIAQLKDLHHYELLKKYYFQLYYLAQTTLGLLYLYIGIQSVIS
ncbi:hypothetical protein QV08_05760 [Gallibacterium salpingitidis]|uniref:DUF4181 domain-containing protein n=1 Tax=Gallibacterium salpingitidis TaxID=505341 RepID=A0AB36E4I3_9PAST|nr:hypothetical protein [Gallibacterium salpingitidis]OBX08149.1 hypothetical protein QV08_05760 [Gallibacterium salpingitidis]OBX11682.1 hypothetical protein QV09_01205 [Gallibacterium salpingitidis]WKT00090.1 hypothetical protein NYR30_01960 [Gallibacterium salpingitidis]